nr:Chain B, Sister chromatid cohesion protein 2 [Saccharomyces cerevisiae]5W94_D Chain D, Sister chromatid cohesion protein 2 [Saccharomyces cerevisiae]
SNAMSYPGKDKNIPGRIIEALEDLPLSYLVPKDGLAALVNAPMRVSLPFDKTIFTSADDGRDVNINVLGTANSTTSSIKNEAEKERLVFKRPSNFTSSANSVDYVPTNFLEGLSPLAQSVLSTHKGLNDSINIEKKSEIVSRPEAKHKLESVTSNAGNLSFNDNSSNKKTKTSTGVTMTQANLA